MITRYYVRASSIPYASKLGEWYRADEVELELEKLRKHIDGLNELLGKAQDEKLLSVLKEAKLREEMDYLNEIIGKWYEKTEANDAKIR